MAGHRARSRRLGLGRYLSAAPEQSRHARYGRLGGRAPALRRCATPSGRAKPGTLTWHSARGSTRTRRPIAGPTVGARVPDELLRPFPGACTLEVRLIATG